MTTKFPPKPWQEGATFTNETTGVGYTYTSGKWLASGGPKVEGEYLPTQGGDMHGNIRMDFDKCIDGRNADGQNYRMLQFRGGQGLEYKAATNNEYNVINRKALEAELAKLPDPPEPAPSPFRKFKYAGDRSWGNMRPGEFQMLDKDQNITNELDKCQAIIFKGEDADGNRAVRDENRISYSSWGGSALNILNSG